MAINWNGLFLVLMAFDIPAVTLDMATGDDSPMSPSRCFALR